MLWLKYFDFPVQKCLKTFLSYLCDFQHLQEPFGWQTYSFTGKRRFYLTAENKQTIHVV